MFFLFFQSSFFLNIYHTLVETNQIGNVRKKQEEEDSHEEEEEEEVEEEEDDDVDEDEDSGRDGSSEILVATSTLASLSNPESIREIGHEAVWSLSTAKPGNGVTQIRDSSVDTYWQSDGGQPHLINIQFSKRAAVCEVAFYLDYSLDESYTPKQLSIRTGITFHDLVEVKLVELNQPVGWCSVPLFGPIDPLDDDEEDNMENDAENTDSNHNNRNQPIRTHFVQICVVSMHQNGRDTHIRQVKIFGPRTEGELVDRYVPLTGGLPRFQTVAMSQYSTIR